MKKIIYLTEKETLCIELLAKGERFSTIHNKCGIPQGSFYLFLGQLRLKTGITDTRNIEMCQSYIDKIEKTTFPPVLTLAQDKLLWMYTELTHRLEFERRTGLTEEELKVQLQAAIEQCGIFSREVRFIRAQLRMHFAVNGSLDNKRLPPSETHLQILRVLADGDNPSDVLGYPPRDALMLTREACARTLTASPGRGAQRALIRAYLAARAEKKVSEITMEDPMF